MSERTRTEIAHAAAAALMGAAPMPPVLVGFDGFIDSIIDLVDRRRDMSPGGYTRIRTISSFAARCAAAAGTSTNIERVIRERRFGGNGPLMAGAMAGLGAPVTYIGAVGEAPAGGSGGLRIHHVFERFSRLCAEAIPVARPSATECLEFDDGKIMLNETGAVQEVTWERIVGVVGLDRLRSIAEPAAAIAVVNWSLLGGVPGIWRGLMRDVLPHLSRRPRRIFIDLSDPAKRGDEDLLEALGLLAEFEGCDAPVSLCINLSEARRIDAVLGCGLLTGADERTPGEQVAEAAAAIRERSGLDTVQIHLRRGAAGAHAGERAWFDGPFTRRPRLSTGAGDHVNGGFAVGQILGLPLAECLALGCAVSGAYVRDAASPCRDRAAGFLRALPEPEEV